MMDSTPILPNSFHPQMPWMTRDFKRFVSPRSRTAHPVKYYITDFGLSVRYSADDTNPLAVPILGGDKSVPEFRNDTTTPRNPFPTDVYYTGNLIRVYFLKARRICPHLRIRTLTNSYSRCIRIYRSWNRSSLAWSTRIQRNVQL